MFGMMGVRAEEGGGGWKTTGKRCRSGEGKRQPSRGAAPVTGEVRSSRLALDSVRRPSNLQMKLTGRWCKRCVTEGYQDWVCEPSKINHWYQITVPLTKTAIPHANSSPPPPQPDGHRWKLPESMGANICQWESEGSAVSRRSGTAVIGASPQFQDSSVEHGVALAGGEVRRQGSGWHAVCVDIAD